MPGLCYKMDSQRTRSIFCGFFTINLVCCIAMHVNEDVYIDLSNGFDKTGCGKKQNPCKTIPFGWSSAKDSNVQVNFYLSSDTYRTHSALDFNCNGVTKKLALIGTSDSFNETVLESSFLVTGCNILISNCTVSSTSEEIKHLFYFSYLTYKNVDFINTTVNIFGEESSLSLMDSVIVNCTGALKYLSLLTLKASRIVRREMTLKNVIFSRNNFGLAFTEGINKITFSGINCYGNILQTNGSRINFKAVSIHRGDRVIFQNITLKNNYNFGVTIDTTKQFTVAKLLTEGNLFIGYGSRFIFNGGTFVLKGAEFRENRIVGAESMIDVQGDSYFYCVNCLFQCNDIGGSTKAPIWFDSNVIKVKLSSSGVSKCPVACDAGNYLKSSLLCVPCGKGKYLESSNSTPTSCKSCPVGTHVDLKMASSCELCSAGTYCSTVGCSLCKECGNEFFSSTRGASSCSRPTTLCLVLLCLTGVLIILPAAVLLLKRRHKDPQRRKRPHGDNFGSQYDEKQLILN